MKIYFRVLSSIVISLIAWSFIIGLVLVVPDLITGKTDPLQNLFVPLFVAFIGLILFGFLGSLIWTIAFMSVNSINLSEFKKHILSAGFSISVTPLFFSRFGDIYSSLILIIPVVLVSLYIYRNRYIKSNT